jgi:hypothetical protein
MVRLELACPLTPLKCSSGKTANDTGQQEAQQVP